MLRVLTCDICDTTHETVRQLQHHLRSVHRWAIQDWNLSRDSVGGQPQCAHCGTSHASIGALRRRVTFGHCTNFDYGRSSETLPVNPDIAQRLQDGQLELLLNDPSTKTSLTLQCQCCGESYSRSTDLAAHLQLCHGGLWAQASPTMNLLTDLLQRHTGCICNPSTPIILSAHVCIGYKQLAMQFHRLPLPVLVPYVHSADDLTRLLCHLPDEMCRLVHNALINRTFDALWTDDTITAYLRSQCVLCGAHFHAADLGPHLHQDHAHALRHAPHFVKQIASSLESQLMDTAICTACGLTFHMPLDADPLKHQQALQHLQGLCPTVNEAKCSPS